MINIHGFQATKGVSVPEPSCSAPRLYLPYLMRHAAFAPET